MKRFQRLLVIPVTLDADDPAVHQGAMLCRASGARMTILWPQDPSSDSGTGLEYLPEVIEAMEQRLEEVRAAVAEQWSVDVAGELRIGKLFLEVVRAVQHEGYDLVLKTGRGKSLGRTTLFGGDAVRLLRQCPCPVWIVDSEHQQESSVLVAVDPMAKGEEAEQVSRTILEMATSLAGLEGAECHVVHVWSTPNERLRRSMSWIRNHPGEDEAEVAAVRQEHEQALGALTDPFVEAYPGLKVHLLRGIAAAEITRVALELNARTLVLATMARTGIPGLLIGNTAEMVINDANRSVLVVKPQNFVSTLSLDPPES